MIVLYLVDESLQPTREEDVQRAMDNWDAVCDASKDRTVQIFDYVKENGREAFVKKFLGSSGEYGIYRPEDISTRKEMIAEVLDLIGYFVIELRQNEV